MKTPLFIRIAVASLLFTPAFAVIASAQSIFAQRTAPTDLPPAMRSANTPVFAAERAMLASSQSPVIGGNPSGTGFGRSSSISSVCGTTTDTLRELKCATS